MTLRTDAFFSQSEAMILSVVDFVNLNGASRYQNAGVQRVYGVETEVKEKIAPGLTLTANGAIQMSSFRWSLSRNGNVLQGWSDVRSIPIIHFNAFIVGEWRSLGASLGAQYGSALQNNTSTAAERVAPVNVPAYTELDVKLRFKLDDTWQVVLTGSQLLENKTTAPADNEQINLLGPSGMPQPGRLVLLGVTYLL